MTQPTNFLGINYDTLANMSSVTKPGGISYVWGYATDTARVYFFNGSVAGGAAVAWLSDIASTTAEIISAPTFNVTPAIKVYHVNCSLTAVTLTLPAAPNQWDEYSFIDTVGGAAIHNITIAHNGNNFQGSATNPVISDPYGMLKIQFNGTQWVQVP